MRLLDDFFPAIAFFIVYKISGIYWGTFALILASALQILYFQMRDKHVKPMYWITFVIILLFGGATILFHDAMFLKWKVSIVNWSMGLAFLGSHFFKRSLLEIFVAQPEQQRFPEGALRKLNFIWGAFFLFIGTLNIYIAYHYSTDVWVDFKVFGLFGLTILFLILQSAYLIYLMKRGKSS